MILAEGFNVNFVTNDSIPFTIFLKRKFVLKIDNKPTVPTTRYGTTIDAIFSRYLYNITSNTSPTAIITEITEDTTNNIP